MAKFYKFFVVIVVLCLVWTAPFLLENANTRYLPVEDKGYIIENYDIDIDVREDRSLLINETITARFMQKSHGITRYLPLEQTVKFYDENDKLKSMNYRNTISDFSYDIVNSSENTYLVDTQKSDGYMFYRMGQSKYIVGLQTYSFSYVFHMGDDRFADKDLFYFNIIGTGWDTKIENVDFDVNFYSRVDASDFKFYVGQYGEDDVGTSQRVHTYFSQNGFSGKVSGLEYGEAITVYNEFDEGFFRSNRNYLFDVLLLIFVVMLLAGIFIFYHFKRRKTPIVDVVEFSAPHDLTPAEVGYINDGKLTGDEISALVVYWAAKGFVKLKQEKGDRIRITKLKDLSSNAKKHEKLFFDALFSGRNEVLSDNLNISDVSVGLKISASIESSQKKCFDTKTNLVYGILVLLSIVAFALMVFKDFWQTGVKGWLLVGKIACVVAIAISLSLYDICVNQKAKWIPKKYNFMLFLDLVVMLAGTIGLMVLLEPYSDAFGARFYIVALLFAFVAIYPRLERYSAHGREVLGRIRGLKNFILVAEKDRIDVLVKENPELFFEILPYAYVLGVTDKYMKMFEDVVIVQPDWYECDSFADVYFAVHLFRGLDFMAYSIRSSMITHSVSKVLSSGGGGRSSGSRGGGSGGFSGGGFGGGGGGRW